MPVRYGVFCGTSSALGIIMETELWPLLAACAAQGVPMMLQTRACRRSRRVATRAGLR